MTNINALPGASTASERTGPQDRLPILMLGAIGVALANPALVATLV